MVVTAVVFLGEATLGIDRAAKLASPNDQRVVQEPTGFEILHESVAGLVDVFALHRQSACDVAVRIPVVQINLHKPHSPLHHASRHQGSVGKCARFFGFLTVEVVGADRFAG